MNNLYLSYKQLSGRWSYNRLFDNGNYGQGTVTFKKNNNNFIYSETGTLNLINGAVLKSKRKYIYRLSRNKLEIYFYETPEILFQTIELKKNGSMFFGQSTHQCKEDYYNSNYIFKIDSEFKITHNVFGPKKNYKSQTTYKKLY
tara:strand:+ start:1745 stop:2176 length:432 start_codon:yes stop_codon:yes gene_type:complete